MTKPQGIDSGTIGIWGLRWSYGAFAVTLATIGALVLFFECFGKKSFDYGSIAISRPNDDHPAIVYSKSPIEKDGNEYSFTDRSGKSVHIFTTNNEIVIITEGVSPW